MVCSVCTFPDTKSLKHSTNLFVVFALSYSMNDNIAIYLNVSA